MTLLIVLLVIIIIINLFACISLSFVLYASIIRERERRAIMREKYYSLEQVELRNE